VPYSTSYEHRSHEALLHVLLLCCCAAVVQQAATCADNNGAAVNGAAVACNAGRRLKTNPDSIVIQNVLPANWEATCCEQVNAYAVIARLRSRHSVQLLLVPTYCWLRSMVL
jgi:hypothetical protein